MQLPNNCKKPTDPRRRSTDEINTDNALQVAIISGVLDSTGAVPEPEPYSHSHSFEPGGGDFGGAGAGSSYDPPPSTD